MSEHKPHFGPNVRPEHGAATMTSNVSKRFRFKRWLRDMRCRLGFHEEELRWEDAYGSHGGDCKWCGSGPLS